MTLTKKTTTDPHNKFLGFLKKMFEIMCTQQQLSQQEQDQKLQMFDMHLKTQKLVEETITDAVNPPTFKM